MLLWCSTNRWLNAHVPRWRFARRAVRRFMPGTNLEAALGEAASLQARGIGALLTCLGESVTRLEEADQVCDHYLAVIDTVAARRLDAHLSVKLTHLGLDLSPPHAAGLFLRLARRAAVHGQRLWIDMEQSGYVDATLAVFRAARAEVDNAGVCLQSYLRRTPADLDVLRPFAPHIRLVKGAYREPPDIAFPRKRDVDHAFEDLARRLIVEARHNGAVVGIGTHDDRLIDRAAALARAADLPSDRCEFEMLYGINRRAWDRLARAGHRVRVLISYGDHWYPWYVRRLAERPANVLFALKSLWR
jgi:proline dehydrogenase